MNFQIRIRHTCLKIALMIFAVAVFFPVAPARLDASTSAGAFPTAAPAGRLQSSVRRMNTWLLGNDQAEGWRRYLSLNILETQAALGPQADIATLETLNNQFSSGVAGLEHPIFADVQMAIKEQIRNLKAARTVNMETVFEVAAEQYRPISIDDMKKQRDRAVADMVFLKNYYNRTMDRRDSDFLLGELQFDELSTFLDSIPFELAPEISVGKLDAAIRDVRKQLNQVIEKIDAIPTPPVTEDGDGSGPRLKAADLAIDQDPEVKQDPIQDLEKQRQAFEAKIAELSIQRKEIARNDAPRRALRRKTAVQFRSFEAKFSQVGKDQGDPYFVAAHQSFQHLMGTYSFGTSDNLEQNYVAKLAILESDFAQIEGENARVYAGKVGDSLRWMENANQVPGLITAIRARHSRPNVYVAISSQLINQISSKSINDTQPVCESMLGRDIRGVSHTQGTVMVELQDDPNQVQATIRLRGNVDSQTYIEQGRLRVCADGCGQLEACRNVFANVGGLFATNAYVSAQFQAYFGGTSSRLKIINRIAAKKFEQSRAKAEALTAKKAEDLLCVKFMEQTSEPIKNGQDSLVKTQISAIADSQYIPQIYLRSFTHQILAVGKKSSWSTLAASDLPPAKGETVDISVRLHDSLPSNYLENILSGKTFTDQELKAEIESLLGRESTASPMPDDATDPAGEDESFSITFPTVRPIQFEFEENRFRIIVSGRRFSQGEKKINEGLKIVFLFKIVDSDGQLKFVRDGKAEIEYLDDSKKTAKAVAFRTFLLGRLNPEEGLEQREIDLPKNLMPVDEVEALQDGPIATRLRLVQCRSENGWLYLGWNYKADDANPVWTYDVPAIWQQEASTK